MGMEKQQRKRTRMVSQAKTGVLAVADDAMRKLFSLSKNWMQKRDVAKNHYELGLSHLQQGHISDAMMRFKLVTWLEPANAKAWYYLGRAQLAGGKKQDASQSFQRSLKLQPGVEEAEYFLAIAGGSSGGALPAVMPQSLSREYFDALAPEFNQQQESLQYEGGRLLAEAVRAAVQDGRVNYAILDLGCGTGLCGRELRPLAGQLTGVDMSPSMLDQARLLQDDQGHKIYDALFQRDMLTFFKENTARFDMVVACGVASYVGEWKDIAHAAAQALQPGGLFAFTADMQDAPGFSLDTDLGRFRFSKAYLESLAAANGFSVVRLDPILSYPGYAEFLCVFRK